MEQANKIQRSKENVAKRISSQSKAIGSTFQFKDNRPEAIFQRKLQQWADKSPLTNNKYVGDAHIQMTPTASLQGVTQRYIKDPTKREEMQQAHSIRYKRIGRIKSQIETVQYEVGNTQVYKDFKDAKLKVLDAQNDENILIEQKYFGQGIGYDGTEKELTNKIGFIDWELDDLEPEVQEFWRDAKIAYDIRSTLRTGAAKWRTDSNRNIPELYAGSVAQGKEILQRKSTLAKLINDTSWFTDTSGSIFVKHDQCRSAIIGYSPSGETDIMLHIGHKNK